MHRASVILALALGIGAAAACTDRGGIDSHAALGSAVAIRASGCATIDAVGVGAVLAPGAVVTVAHVVAGADDIAVIDRSGRGWTATIAAIDTADDLAVLAVPGLTAASLEPAAFAAGDRGVYVTFDDDARPVVERFEVLRRVTIAISDIYDEGDHERAGFEIRAEVDPGDSGAVLVSPRGGAGGVVFASSRETEERAWATDVSLAAELLARTDVPPNPVDCP